MPRPVAGRVNVPLNMPGVAGIFVGGCVTGEDAGFEEKADAHAHYQQDAWAGWICFKTAESYGSREVRDHEYAHILSDSGHTAAFWEVLAYLRRNHCS